MWELVRSISVALWLCYLAVKDWKTKTVPSYVLFIGSALPLFCGMLRFGDNPKSHIAGIVMGMFFLLLSKLTEEGIAYADSWLILVLGFYLGFWEVVGILTLMWVILIPVSMVQFIRRKGAKKATIPMVPFLTVAYLITLINGIIGKGGSV